MWEEQSKADSSLEPVDQYLRTFSWNKVKYRADKPLGEIIDLLQKVRITEPIHTGAC